MNNKLNITDMIKLFIKSKNNINYIKQFLDHYYNIKEMPIEFYNMFSYCNKNHNYIEIYRVLKTKNIYNLISFLKYDNINIRNIEKVLTPQEYFKLPYKQIKKIIEYVNNLDICNEEIPLKKENSDSRLWLLRKTALRDEDEIIIIAIKMYLLLGFDNSIKLLSNKYGQVDYEIIFFLFNNLNIKNRNNKNIDIFQSFFINNIESILNNEYNELFLNFDYFYNSLDFFIEKLGTKLNKNKVLTLLKERYTSYEIENPEITGDIIEDMISSYYHKYGITDEESEIISKNMKAYNEKLKNKTKTSILKTDKKRIENYTFEMIPLSDSRNLVMGYRAGNCFRINGDALVLFNSFLTNPHMRLLSISTDEYKDFGMVLLMRNGNVLIAQGIETSKRIPKELTGEKLYNATKEVIEKIMNEMNNNNDEIVASIIGLSNSNTSPYNKNILPFIIKPILNNDNNYYNGIDCYQGLLSLKEGKTINDIKLFIPKNLYDEKNNRIYIRNHNEPHNSINYMEVEKVFLSLRYARFKEMTKDELINYYDMLVKKKEEYLICTNDWYIIKFQDGTYDYFNKSNDKAVINEYNKIKNQIKDSEKYDKSSSGIYRKR